MHEANSATPEYHARSGYAWYCTLALLLACTIPAFTWAKGQWIWFRCFTLVFWISMNTLLPEVLVPPSGIFNFATMDPRANIACAALALAANVALFAYWLYKIVAFKRNPITGVLYCELAEFRTIVREHCDDKDKYFLVDRIPETPPRSSASCLIRPPRLMMATAPGCPGGGEKTRGALLKIDME